MDPDHTIDLSGADAGAVFDVPLVVITARKGTASHLDAVEIWNPLEDVWEGVPKYSNFGLFADARQPSLDPDPDRYLHHSPTASHSATAKRAMGCVRCSGCG